MSCINTAHHGDPDGVDVFRSWDPAAKQHNNGFLLDETSLNPMLNTCLQLFLHILQPFLSTVQILVFLVNHWIYIAVEMALRGEVKECITNTGIWYKKE